MKKVILASTSTLYNGDYLDYLLPVLSKHFSNCKTLLFIPYARPSGISHDDYTQKVSVAFAKINITVNGIHEYKNPVEAIQKAEAILTNLSNQSANPEMSDATTAKEAVKYLRLLQFKKTSST